MPALLASDFYYLKNFQTALAWIRERSGDLLVAEEVSFLDQFAALERPSQALLVRLVMRKGPHFRASKLVYPEIGEITAAARPLLALGWLSDCAPLPLTDLFALLRKDELREHLPLSALPRTLKKAAILEQLADLAAQTRTFGAWCPSLADRLYSLTIGELCDRLRLLFFGNLNQDWSEFVLADLAILRYEPVALTPDSRGFRSREDLEGYLFLHQHRARFEAGEEVAAVLASLAPFHSDNPYLQSRHAKLLLLMAQQLEKQHELEPALALYRRSDWGAARWRQIRVLERLERDAEAHERALAIARAPRNDEEAQLVERALRRLTRRLGLPQPPRRPAPAERRLELTLERPATGRVEDAVRAHLHLPQAPVHYVENTLICGLFGLLCWEAIFAPLPGAFFHPFHSGPADLRSPDFHARRAGLFEACLGRLDSDAYREDLRRTYRAKVGTVSPFVFWPMLSEELLELALLCIPAAHLRACFERLLGDLENNRAGLPDLIQFFPEERRYRLIEVKGPGDRLQDNQRRWLGFFALQGIPAEVCYVTWDEDGGG